MLVSMLPDEAPPTSERVPGFCVGFPLHLRAYLAGEMEKGSTVNEPMGTCPPIGVPSKALSDGHSYSVNLHLFQRALATQSSGGRHHKAQVWLCFLRAR